MNTICDEKKSSSEMFSVFRKLPQVLVNAKVDNTRKYNYMDDEIGKTKIMELEKNFDGTGRVLIRPSGTEPLVRVMLEGECLDEIKRKAEELSGIIEERLNN